MSDVLEAAAASMNTPPELVRRSAAARAEATGVTVDEVLSAWTGGAPVTTAPVSPPSATSETAEEAPAATAESAPVAVAVMESPAPAVAASEPEPTKPLEAVPLGIRVKTATRLGAWTGAALGFFGFIAASAFWAPTAAVAAESGPTVITETRATVIGLTLVSILFGAIVASFSRAATEWISPATELTNTKTSTAWWGAAAGLVLGLIGGAILVGGLGTPIETTEEMAASTQLSVSTTLVVMIVGGALAGAITAALPQILGTPVALAEDTSEVTSVKRRLQGAVSIPVAGLLLLLLLVLPFAFTLLRSAELSPLAAPIVAVITAGAILGFATLAGSRPHMKITLGELMVAVISVVTVLLIILAALFFAGGGGEDEGNGPSEAVAVVAQL